MGLSDFERELAKEKKRDSTRRNSDDENAKSRHHHRHRSRREDEDDSRHRNRSNRHRDHDLGRKHRSYRDDNSHTRHRSHRDEHEGEERRRRHKRRHEGDESYDEARERRREKRHRSRSPGSEDDGRIRDMRLQANGAVRVSEKDPTMLDKETATDSKPVDRDAWMRAPPTAEQIEIVASRRPKTPPGRFVGSKGAHGLEASQSDTTNALADLRRDLMSEDEDETHIEYIDRIGTDLPAQHDVDYVFGDSGSEWRMTKLRAVYRQAEESGRSIDDVALQQYGYLRDFDDAREEERELGRRRTLGKDYIGIEKPSGELFQERKMAEKPSHSRQPERRQSDVAATEASAESTTNTQRSALDVTALNKLRAQAMKAKLRGDPDAASLEAEYKLAEASSLSQPLRPITVAVGNKETSALAVQQSKGAGESDEMSIADMVREERRSRHGGNNEARELAERISKDARFKDSLDYMDENASKLAQRGARSTGSQRDAAIAAAHRSHTAMNTCPLCHDGDDDSPPIAPVISLGTRTFLTIAPDPALTPGSVVIAPLQHRSSLLECDDDEWEELRNFMKSLTAHYAAGDRGVIFYEDASQRQAHAALVVVPLPEDLADDAPAYFREALLSAAPAWSTHHPVLDTQARGGGGRLAFRRALPKELPYFHVFLTLDGGLAQIIEEARQWPSKGRFARDVLGGMLDAPPEVVRRAPRWERGMRGKAEEFRKKWKKWDWTAALVDAPA